MNCKTGNLKNSWVIKLDNTIIEDVPTKVKSIFSETVTV